MGFSELLCTFNEIPNLGLYDIKESIPNMFFPKFFHRNSIIIFWSNKLLISSGARLYFLVLSEFVHLLEGKVSFVSQFNIKQ